MRSTSPHERQPPRHAARLALAILALAASLGGAVYAFGSPFADRRVAGERQDARPTSGTAGGPLRGTLALRAGTGRRTVAPGGRSVHRISVQRGGALIVPADRGRSRLAAPVRVRVVGGLRAGVSARLRPSPTRTSPAWLTLRTTRDTPDGTYRVHLAARGRLHARPGYRAVHARTVVTLVVSTPHPRRFTIRGAVPTRLSPGVSVPVDLRLTNPHRYRLRIRRLVVRVVGVRAPQADRAHPCTVADFTRVAFSDARGIVLPASSTRRLSALRVSASRRPRVGMANRPVNQDGCKRASLTLGFAGSATRGGR